MVSNNREKAVAAFAFFLGVLLCYSVLYFWPRRPPLEVYQNKFANQMPAGFFGAGVKIAHENGGVAVAYRIVDDEILVFEIRHNNAKKTSFFNTGRYNETFVTIRKLTKKGQIEANEFGQIDDQAPTVSWRNFTMSTDDIHSKFPGYRKDQVDFLIRCTQKLSETAYHGFRDD